MRMYFFVMYNLSGIQKGIQAAHALSEYQIEHGKSKKYLDWARNHKTIILLSGGGSDDMVTRDWELDGLSIKASAFYEPDLNESLSAIAFLVPEAVYSKDESVIAKRTKKEQEFADYLSKFRLA